MDLIKQCYLETKGKKWSDIDEEELKKAIASEKKKTIMYVRSIS